MSNKEKFLEEHNKLSPKNLQITDSLLSRFKDEKRPLLKSDGWSIDKLRIPLISWLLSLPIQEKIKQKGARRKMIFKDYPRTK